METRSKPIETRIIVATLETVVDIGSTGLTADELLAVYWDVSEIRELPDLEVTENWVRRTYQKKIDDPETQKYREIRVLGKEKEQGGTNYEYLVSDVIKYPDLDLSKRPTMKKAEIAKRKITSRELRQNPVNRIIEAIRSLPNENHSEANLA